MRARQPSAFAPHRRCARQRQRCRAPAQPALRCVPRRHNDAPPRPRHRAAATRASASATSSRVAATSRRRSRLPPSSTTPARLSVDSRLSTPLGSPVPAKFSNSAPTRYCGPSASASPRARSAARAASLALSCTLYCNASSNPRVAASTAADSTLRSSRRRTQRQRQVPLNDRAVNQNTMYRNTTASRSIARRAGWRDLPLTRLERTVRRAGVGSVAKVGAVVMGIEATDRTIGAFMICGNTVDDTAIGACAQQLWQCRCVPWASSPWLTSKLCSATGPNTALARMVSTDFQFGYPGEHAHARDDEHHAQPSAAA